MNTTPSTVITQTESRLLQYADALIAYAATNKTFAESLAYHIQSRHWLRCDVSPHAVSKHLMPSDQIEATRTANWLLQELDQRPEANCTRGLFATWADTYKEPKNAVLGIVGIAIIGPTLGIISTKKKKKRKMQLVLDAAWANNLDTQQLVEKTHELSQTLAAKEIRLACGAVDRLHPDMAQWLLAGSTTKLYLASKTDLVALLTEIETENIPHLAVIEQDEVVAVCVAPSVNDELVDDVVQ